MSQDYCIRKFMLPVPIRIIEDYLSWDDILAGIYILVNFVIITLGTVNIIKQFTKREDPLEREAIIRSQKILRIVMGVVSILMGLFNVYVYYRISSQFTIQNRGLLGVLQALTGIVLVIFASYELQSYDTQPEKKEQ